MTLVFITGASGFAGTHLTRYLETIPHVAIRSFNLRHGDDIRNPDQIRNAIARTCPDVVIHLAGQAFVPESTTNPRRGFEVNTLGTLNLLEAVRHTGSRTRVLLAGTSAEYGPLNGREIDEQTTCTPDTAYGVTKLAATTLGMFYHAQYGIPVVVSRAFNHTGPGHQSVYALPWFAKQLVEIERGQRATLSHGDLDAVRSYADVRDIVRGYWDLATRARPGIYNIGSGRFHTIDEILQEMITISGVSAPLNDDSTLYRDGMRVGQQSPATVSFAKIRKEIDWIPTFPLTVTLQDVIQHWRSR